MISDTEACYAAHRGRDARFDGVFFTAVKTTRIYCRPVCSARTPARSSCLFYSTAGAAEAAGFRPCLRCRPELAPGLDAAGSLAHALLRYIQGRALEGVTLAEMEAGLGMSLRQARRVLLAELGVTQVQILHTHRLLMAKQWLHETTAPVSEIALAAGFRSLRCFNACFRDHYGLPPTALRKKDPKNATGNALSAGGTVTLRLAYRAPLAWTALLDYFRSRLVPGVEEILENEYRRTVQVDGACGWLRVRPLETADALSVEVSSSLFRVLGVVQSRLRRLFDLDARPDIIAEHLKDDPLLTPVLTKYDGLRVGGAWDVFELAVRAVLGQQITVKAATTIAARLAQATGQVVETPFPGLTRLGITAEAVAALDVNALCALGMVRARAETLRHLSAFTLAGGLDFPPGASHEDVVTRLVQLPGIGPWTAHYIAMRALRYPDAFPAADLGLRKALGQGTLIPTKQAEAHSQIWRPWRAYAAAALWKSLEMT
jgi:AraC family transcriptional regulator, regulatory protein of adaptative response / DNA-3-methyladenine glycosylase II